MSNEGFDYEKAAYDFLDERPVWKLIFFSIKAELLPNSKNWFGFAFSIVTGAVLACFVGMSEETVMLTENISNIFLDVQMAVFSCIFAVYSLLLAFLSDSYIKKLLEIGYHNETNYLQKSTRYYEAALFIYFVAIMLSLSIKIAMQCVPKDFVLTNNGVVNEIIACILLLAYFVYSIRTVYELKSIIGNTLLLFRASMAFKIKAFSKDTDSQHLTEDEVCDTGAKQ